MLQRQSNMGKINWLALAVGGESRRAADAKRYGKALSTISKRMVVACRIRRAWLFRDRSPEDIEGLAASALERTIAELGYRGLSEQSGKSTGVWHRTWC